MKLNGKPIRLRLPWLQSISDGIWIPKSLPCPGLAAFDVGISSATMGDGRDLNFVQGHAHVLRKSQSESQQVATSCSGFSMI